MRNWKKHKTRWTEQTNDGKIVHEVQILDSKIGDLRLELNTVKLGDKERFDKEQIGVKEPFSVTEKSRITKLGNVH